jgi:2-polyprenyl-3-methyl-5-hydroxy-6-metoxy-1,4-benzoquinol methylase
MSSNACRPFTMAASRSNLQTELFESAGPSEPSCRPDTRARTLVWSNRQQHRIHSDEQHRLDAQGAQLRPYTERLLRDAGVGAGVRVFDAGCGTGDMSILAAELVGSTGEEIGVDRSVDVLQTAACRVKARGWTRRVHFLAGDLSDVASPGGPVDAIIGRNVLMHQQDLGGVVRRLASLTRPCGRIVFAEPVLLAPS